MSCIYEGDVVAGGEADAQATGGALVIVDFHDFSAEGGAPAILKRFFGDERDR